MLQAYHATADSLKQQGTRLASKRSLRDPPDDLEESLMIPIKKTRHLVQRSGFVEQVESLLPRCSSREVQTALEMAMGLVPAVPKFLSDLYGK